MKIIQKDYAGLFGGVSITGLEPAEVTAIIDECRASVEEDIMANIRPAQFIPVDAYLSRCQTDLVVLLENTEGVRDSIIVPIRRIQDTYSYEVIVPTRRLWDTWRGSNAAMRGLGFRAQKSGGRWIFHWRG